MHGAGAGGPAGQDLGTLRDKAAQLGGVFVIDILAFVRAELADLATEVQQEAELMLNADQTHVMRVVEAGINGDETLDDIVADWNAAWDAAVDACAPQ